MAQNTFYTPDFALIEINKYRSVILKKSRLKLDALNEYTFRFFRKLIVVPDYVISDNSLQKAIDLCADIDLKDTIYIALAIELNTTLLTRDKPLYDGLIAKGFMPIQLFDDFIRQQSN